MLWLDNGKKVFREKKNNNNTQIAQQLFFSFRNPPPNHHLNIWPSTKPPSSLFLSFLVQFSLKREMASSVAAGCVGGEAYKAHVAMAFVQLINGGYHVIAKVALNVGINQLVSCVFRNLIALFILAPVAYISEKYLPFISLSSFLWFPFPVCY